MHLKEPSKLLEVWRYALGEGASIILMRHGPKAGSDQSGLSEAGQKLTQEYGGVLRNLGGVFDKMLLAATSKDRTIETLKLMFPESDPGQYLKPPELDTIRVTPEAQRSCDDLHARLGHWRGYTVSQTFYYLQKYTGSDDTGLHGEVKKRIVDGIRKLLAYQQPVIYCGHSPQTEAAVAELTGLDLAELGWFLDPLSSIHLRMRGGTIEFIARVNPIIGYIDLEAEAYYQKQPAANLG